jgi:hypothetical protein
MEGTRIEALSRRVAQAGSRRAALAVLAGALAAPLLGGLGGEEAAAGIPIAHCKVPGKRCSTAKKCCTGACRKHVCQCAKRGHACWAPLEGALCCSRKCQSGKCA